MSIWQNWSLQKSKKGRVTTLAKANSRRIGISNEMVYMKACSRKAHLISIIWEMFLSYQSLLASFCMNWWILCFFHVKHRLGKSFSLWLRKINNGKYFYQQSFPQVTFYRIMYVIIKLGLLMIVSGYGGCQGEKEGIM